MSAQILIGLMVLIPAMVEVNLLLMLGQTWGYIIFMMWMIIHEFGMPERFLNLSFTELPTLIDMRIFL